MNYTLNLKINLVKEKIKMSLEFCKTEEYR